MTEQAKPETEKILSFACDAGKVLIESGADITRVEDTLKHILNAYGVTKYDMFTLTNCIILTATEAGAEASITEVRNIPAVGTNLGKVDAVNTLSRRIAEKKYTVDEARDVLSSIEKMKKTAPLIRMAASGVGSGMFCLLLGGSPGEALAAFAVGFLFYVLVLLIEDKKYSRLLTHLLASALATLLSFAIYKCIPAFSMDKIIIGAIMPLLPGVAFVNAIRDIAAGDYLSGTIRLIDTLLVAAGIAVGVGAVLALATFFGLM